MFVTGLLFQVPFSLKFPLFAGLQRVNEESVAKFSSWNRNNSFSGGAHRTDVWMMVLLAILGARKTKQCLASCFIQQSFAIIQKPFNCKILYLFYMKGARKEIRIIFQMQVTRRPCLSSAQKSVLIRKKLIYVTASYVLMWRWEQAPWRWRAVLHAIFLCELSTELPSSPQLPSGKDRVWVCSGIVFA